MISFDTFLAAAALTGVLAGPPSALGPDQDVPRAGRSESERAAMEAQREAARRDREDRRYEEGQDAIEEGAWQRAVTVFTDLAQAKGTRTDAAMYWRAYALDRMGQKAEALAATSELIKSYPKSKWINDAKALELQVRQTSGQPVRPEAEADEELKLLALQGLQHSAPEQPATSSRTLAMRRSWRPYAPRSLVRWCWDPAWPLPGRLPPPSRSRPWTRLG